MRGSMGLIGYALKKLLKKKKEEVQQGIVQEKPKEEQEDRELGKKIWQAKKDITKAFREKGIRVGFGASIYAYLLDPEAPEKSAELLQVLENIKKHHREPIAPYPFGAYVVYRMMVEDPRVRVIVEEGITSAVTMLFDFFAVTHGHEHPSELLSDPDALRKFLVFARQLKRMGLANTPAGVLKKEDLYRPSSVNKWGVAPPLYSLAGLVPEQVIDEALDTVIKIVESYLTTLERRKKITKRKAGKVPKQGRVAVAPEAAELKRFLGERLKGLPEEEIGKVWKAVEVWVLQLAGRVGALEKIEEGMGVLKKVVEGMAKVHGLAVAAAFLKAAGEMGLSKEEFEALGQVLSDPATKRLSNALRSKYGIKELALYLAGVLDRKDLRRIWAESFSGTKIPQKVLRRLSEGRSECVAVRRFQVLGEVLRAVVRAGSSGELLGVLEVYEGVFGEHAGVLAWLANVSGKLLKDREFRKLAEGMGEEVFGVVSGVVLRALRLADAVGESLRAYLPALRPVVADEGMLRQVLESVVREWWARNVSAVEAEYVGRYASVLVSGILQRVGGAGLERVEEVRLALLQLHLMRSAEFFAKLSRRLGEARLTVLGNPERLPEGKVEVLEAVLRTVREHYPGELVLSLRLGT